MAVNLEMSVEYEAPNYQNVKKSNTKAPLPARNTQYRGKDMIYTQKYVLKDQGTGRSYKKRSLCFENFL